MNNSKKLQGLIDSLLFASSSQNGSIRYQFDRILVNDIINTSIQHFYAKASEKKISIVNTPNHESVYVNGDTDYLPRVFMNLLDNAIKFTPDDGMVNFSTSCENGNVHITVTDTGIGVPEECGEQLFQKFYQVDSSSTRSYGGNGLGLYISKVIVEGHGGQIWLESEKGMGTTVHVELPAVN